MFKDKLKQLRKKKGLTQKELAEMLYISRPALSLYESGKRQPDLDTLVRIARFFNVTVDYLINDSVRPLQQFETIKTGKLLQIPVIGCIKSTKDNILCGELLGYEYMDGETFENCDECFFFQVKGNSMKPEIKEGDLALIRRQADVSTNTLALVVVGDDGEAMIKKIVKYENTTVLQSYDPDYPPIVVTSKDKFKIVGEVIGIFRRFT